MTAGGLGRELNSDDVKYNIIRARDPKVGAGQFSKPANWFNEIDTPDKYTVVLKSEDPRPLAFDFFEYFNIVDKDAMESPDAKEKLVGTGPFTFVEWLQGDHLTFTRNKNYSAKQSTVCRRSPCQHLSRRSSDGRAARGRHGQPGADAAADGCQSAQGGP
jgi:ABC-type transport system substrate-binding protein